jgi:hypothetical protein
MSNVQPGGPGQREVYSPRIRAELIPVLYHTARAKTMPMTSLVDVLLYKALAVEPIPAEARGYLTGISVGGADAILSEMAGLEGDLELKLRSARADPFDNIAEVEAWYHGCEHGLLRSRQLLARGGKQSEARNREQMNVLRLLNVFRKECRRVLRERGA